MVIKPLTRPGMILQVGGYLRLEVGFLGPRFWHTEVTLEDFRQAVQRTCEDSADPEENFQVGFLPLYKKKHTCKCSWWFQT